jgi:hypothetical protein
MFHVSYDIGYLLRRPDEELLMAVSGCTALEMRAALVCMQAAGKRHLVIGNCDHRARNGACLGHAEGKA